VTTISSSSNLPVNRAKGLPVWLILALISILSVAVYLLVSAITYRIGFPLDDAWIHQTYARNLALYGEWAFNLGKPSGGSTSPLWSAILAIGFLLKLAPYVWTYLLGAVALCSLSILGENSVRKILPAYHPRFPWVGAALALEWHLVWAAASGMETILFALLATAALVLIISGSRNYFSLGLLIGISVWVRPDGITLLGPALLVLFLSQPTWPKRLRALFNFGVGFGSPFVLYLLFNLVISGRPWPNTFYAKQAEYAVYLKLPFLERLGSEGLQLLIGVGVVLLPGVVLSVISAVRRRAWGLLASAIWLIGFLALYAWRLPVTYQHGRYIIPAMPIFFLLGLTGLAEFCLKQRMHGTGWLLPTFWRLTVGVVLLVFWGRGSFAYAQDVAVIESEMVTTAKWVSLNLPTDTLLAAHDIGALGYFGGHELVDLAGLISPEVIPFLGDQNRIATYLTERGVRFLVVFPDWYPSLTSKLVPVYSTGAPYAPALGGKNMTVYRWQSP
jgi:TM2 domain-containing membrane protein YozV